jgi:hypothetical protein
MPTTTTMRHDSSGTRIDLGADVQANGLRIDEVTMQTPHAIATRKHFLGPGKDDIPMDFCTEDIHVLRAYDVEVDVVESEVTGGQCIVRIDTHVHLYLPLNFAKAIADAMNAYVAEVAS